MNHPVHKGRGALGNPDGRYNRQTHAAVDDGWDTSAQIDPLKTTVTVEVPRTVISRNQSPDLPFEQSVNPYRGCEHGCIYCYARPTHAYLGLSPGLDFESKLVEKPSAPELLRKELGKRNYLCKPIALGTNTDPYQPIERDRKITRELLRVLSDCDHPVMITTKSSLIERDIDLLQALATRNLVQVMVSITTLNRDLARRLEPRAPAPERRLETVSALTQAGVPVGVMVAPVIPFLTDHEMETILARSRAVGAEVANYILLRLPLELKELVEEWLHHHEPLKADRIMNTLLKMHDGQVYRSDFAVRQSGSGEHAKLLRDRFAVKSRRLGFKSSFAPLDTTRFHPPRPLGSPTQLELF